MPNSEFFVRLGLFVKNDFLDAESRVKLLNEARMATTAPATLADDSVRADKRRAHWPTLSDSTSLLLTSRMHSLRPALERHFGVKLEGFEDPQYLIYKTGDFYTPHRDSSDHDVPKYITQRKISIVIFLNQQVDKPTEGTYTGGSLTLYGVIDRSGWNRFGFPLKAGPGLLIAFPSHIWHEVTPITCGERHTVASWFF